MLTMFDILYSNMAPKLPGQNYKLILLSLNIPNRDLDTKKTTPNIELCPASEPSQNVDTSNQWPIFHTEY